MSRPTGPLCMKCHVIMVPTEIGVEAVFHAFSPPQPYEVWTGDVRTCPKCAASVLTGWADQARAAHYTPEKMQQVLASTPPDKRVDVF